MDDMCQHISLSRRPNNVVKLRLCNTAAERYRQSKRPRGSNEPRGRFSVSKNLRGKLFYPKTVPIFVSLRGRSAAVAILKPKAWHPMAKHGSTKQKENPITKNMGFVVSFCFLFLHFKVLFHSVQP